MSNQIVIMSIKMSGPLHLEVMRFSAIEVGQPVTRLPPHSPLRAELPHKVPQSYSLRRSHRSPMRLLLFSAVRFAPFIRISMSGRSFLCGLRNPVRPFPM